MTIEGLETYILVPRDPTRFGLARRSVASHAQSAGSWTASLGLEGLSLTPQICNGLMVPVVLFDQIYSFDREALIKAIPRPDRIPAEEFAPAAEQLFDRIMQMADNAGATDEHRALNYCAVRYQAIYANAADAFARNQSLTGVDVSASPLSGTRKVLNVVLSYTDRNTDVVEKYSCRVDVTEEFPFLVTKLSPYYDR